MISQTEKEERTPTKGGDHRGLKVMQDDRQKEHLKKRALGGERNEKRGKSKCNQEEGESE